MFESERAGGAPDLRGNACSAFRLAASDLIEYLAEEFESMSILIWEDGHGESNFY